MNTTTFNGQMTEELKERISLSNKKILKELTKEELHDVLWIYEDKEIRSFFERGYSFNENGIKMLMESFYICDIYVNYRYERDILVILEKKYITFI